MQDRPACPNNGTSSIDRFDESAGLALARFEDFFERILSAAA
jgi:hypothetical protein